MSRRARHLIGAHAALRRQWGDDPRARLIFTDLDEFLAARPAALFQRGTATARGPRRSTARRAC